MLILVKSVIWGCGFLQWRRTVAGIDSDLMTSRNDKISLWGGKEKTKKKKASVQFPETDAHVTDFNLYMWKKHWVISGWGARNTISIGLKPHMSWFQVDDYENGHVPSRDSSKKLQSCTRPRDVGEYFWYRSRKCFITTITTMWGHRGVSIYGS